MSIIPGGPRQGGTADPSTLLPPRDEQPTNQKPGAGGEGTDADAITPGDPNAGDGEPTEQAGNPGGKETGGSPTDAVVGDRNPGQSDPLNGGRGDHPGWGNNGWGNGWGNNGRGNGWGNGGIPPGLADRLGNFGNQGQGQGQASGGNGLISDTLNQVGQIVSNLGTLISGRNPAGGDVLLPRTGQDSSFDAGNGIGRNGPPVPGNDPGRTGNAPDGRAPGQSNPQMTQPAGSGRTDGPPVSRGNSETTTANPGGQPVATGRPVGAEARGTPLAGGNAGATPQAMQQPAQAQAQTAGVLTAGLSAAVAQQALLGGLATNQTAVPQQAVPQNAQLQQNALQNAQARQAAGLPLTPEQRALLQGSQVQVPNPAANTPAQEKPLSAPPQQALRGDESRNPQQLPADAKRQAETMDRALAKQTAEQQQARTANDPRTTDAQARADAKALREGVDNKTRANLADARQNVGENAKQNSQLANAERRPGGATESLRQALDWVGQQVRGVGADARTDEEGVTAMRVVAGLVVAATVVGVAIAVLYALRVAFVP